MSSAWDIPPRPYGRIRGGGAPFEPRRRLPPPRRERPTLIEPGDARAVGFRMGRLRVDLDGVFAFLIFTPMLFIAQLTTLGAAAVAALAPLYLFVRRERLGRTLLPRAFLFVVPAFALLSVAWSEAPPESFRYACEFFVTVTVGLLLSSARSQQAVLRGLAAAFAAYIAVSVGYGGSVAIGVGAGGEAFSGLSSSKNLLADIASTGLIVSAVVAMMAMQSRSWLWIAFAAAAIGLDLYAVVSARSAGALLGLGMAVVAIVGLTPLVFAGRVLRAWVTSVVALLLLAVGLGYQTLAGAMIDMGATLFDKDPTLTGRTYLWYRAADLIREKPFLGRGYYAFWLQGNTDAEGLWRYFGIQERGGFTFHNTAVEILVTLGWAGLAVIGLTAVVAAIALIRRFVVRPNLALVFWIAIFLYQLARTPIEAIGIAPFYFSTVLCFAALGAAFGRIRQPEAAPQPRRPVRELQVVTVDGQPAGWTAAQRGGLQRLRTEPGPDR